MDYLSVPIFLSPRRFLTVALVHSHMMSELRGTSERSTAVHKVLEQLSSIECDSGQ